MEAGEQQVGRPPRRRDFRLHLSAGLPKRCLRILARGQTSNLRRRAPTRSMSMTVRTTMMTIAAVSEYWKLRMLS